MSRGLSIGDELFRVEFNNTLLKYSVTAIIRRDVGTRYEVECLSCNHEPKCRLLIGEVDGAFLFDCMANNEDEHYECWHRPTPFALSENEAWIIRVEIAIEDTVAERDKVRKSLKEIEKRLVSARKKLSELKQRRKDDD